VIRAIRRVVRRAGADEADEGVAVGEDADDVGAALDFFVEALLYPGLEGRVNRWVDWVFTGRVGGGGR
jgi:hypothetical protein